jgi:FKBP-type peptidyl-prolyl cis-trans isomerase
MTNNLFNHTVAILLTLLFMTGCTMTNSNTPPEPTLPSTTNELVRIDTQAGSGQVAQVGNTARVHYTGWLFTPGENGAPGKKGNKFDSSRDRNDPFEFTIGQRRVIGGWEQGVVGMAVGGKRTLVIPPELGYGARGAGGVIPPNATLVFDIELLAVR